jgi:hypothetical protein
MLLDDTVHFTNIKESKQEATHGDGIAVERSVDDGLSIRNPHHEIIATSLRGSGRLTGAMGNSLGLRASPRRSTTVPGSMLRARYSRVVLALIAALLVWVPPTANPAAAEEKSLEELWDSTLADFRQDLNTPIESILILLNSLIEQTRPDPMSLEWGRLPLGSEVFGYQVRDPDLLLEMRLRSLQRDGQFQSVSVTGIGRSNPRDSQARQRFEFDVLFDKAGGWRLLGTLYEECTSMVAGVSWREVERLPAGLAYEVLSDGEEVLLEALAWENKPGGPYLVSSRRWSMAVDPQRLAARTRLFLDGWTEQKERVRRALSRN